MRNVCIFLLMVCSLYACKEGCGNKEVNADLTISFPPSVNTPILEYIDTVKYLKLEDKDEALLAYVNKMVCREDKIYLGDFSNHKIVVYDTIGRFQYVIDRQGRGSGEYLQIKSFAVDDSVTYDFYFFFFQRWAFTPLSTFLSSFDYGQRSEYYSTPVAF